MTRDKWTTVYASFLQYAWNPEARRYRNFMRFDRSWCEDVGSEDSNGRTLWALGVTARDAQLPKHRDWAQMWFDATASLALDLGSLRAQAFAMLGAAAMLEARPGHQLARAILEKLPRCIWPCSKRHGGRNGSGSRSCWPMTMPACRRR